MNYDTSRVHAWMIKRIRDYRQGKVSWDILADNVSLYLDTLRIASMIH